MILGLIGLFWQAYKTKRITTPNGEEIEEPVGIQQFWIVFFLFFMTGLAIVLYLNQTPMQPRERDYAYAGSFYAFAIWIGLGVAAIAEYLSKKINEKPAAILASVGLLTSTRANGKPNMGRPRPQQPLCGTRLRTKLPEHRTGRR